MLANNSDVSDPWTISAPLPLLLSKGKDKLYEGFAFFENGMFSAKAIRALKAGYLAEYSPAFGVKSVNLEAPVGKGLFAEDILHHACLDTLTIVGQVLQSPPPLMVDLPFLDDLELLPVDGLLVEMGLEPSEEVQQVVVSKKRGREADSA